MNLRAQLQRLFPPMRWRHRITRESLLRDLGAGIIGALIVLPQGVAFATLAGLPPEYGLYAAIVPTAVAALFGSSLHTVSGPTNAISMMTLASLAPLAAVGSPEYINLALSLALLMGIFMVALGAMRMGVLVNFISQPVVIGFTAGAGVLIMASQLPALLGLPSAPSPGITSTLPHLWRHIGDVHGAAFIVGGITFATGMVVRRFWPRIPNIVVAMLVGVAVAALIEAVARGSGRDPALAYLGAIPRTLPPLSIPVLDTGRLAELAGLAGALSIVALTQSVSIARAVAMRSGQRIDGNQEFIGQGLSNIAGAFFSGMPTSASVNRSGPNYDSGAQTPLAAVFAALALAAIVVALAPLVLWLPIAAIAAVLLLASVSLIDIARMRETFAASPREGWVLVLTLVATVFLRLDVAVLTGVAASLLLYLSRTSRPMLRSQVPGISSERRGFVPISRDREECPQLKLLAIEGSIYFGAVDHVATHLEILREISPHQKSLLLLARNMNFVDVAGATLLGHEARRRRDAGGRLYLQGLRPSVEELLVRGGMMKWIGEANCFDTKHKAIATIYEQLDPKICARCSIRIFFECQEKLPGGMPREAAGQRPPKGAQ